MQERMRLIGFVLGAAIACAGCKSVNVSRYEIQHRDRNGLTIVAYTTEDLASLDKTPWADHVYLRYAVTPVTILERFDVGATDLDDYPFSARRLDIHARCPVPTSDFCSSWFIPFHDRVGLHGLDYVSGLDASEPARLKLRIGGASMAGTRLVSKEHAINVDAGDVAKPNGP
ncbi:TPA: hypothetical protein RJR39_006421 [Burkholderia cenocepacia]|uniref:hypothetical protein n=1 Tax=Burkholderia cenocepacia TaxID=95486 RepID=UPI001BA13976|nr:hypothetical protein [Burkholderia cenocepacia]MBR8200779.1 hypothetical protein [Burkholderia cenocepacia]HDV6330281.1 hypothetical protein [Burkholderia cenocepacia]HDV6356385.1 hypothetical protein [Burkholderia cenocepacia]